MSSNEASQFRIVLDWGSWVFFTAAGAHFKMDLMHRKAEVKSIIEEVINNMTDDEDDGDEDEDNSGNNEEDKNTKEEASDGDSKG